MMGVVLWSDTEDQKAVFWCEDHGDLAYFDASLDETLEQRLLHPGDMVQFDVSVVRKVRRAHNASLVETEVCNGLQEKLRDEARQNDDPLVAPLPANVVQLVPREAQRRPA